MKKIISVILAVMMLVALTACGEKTSSQTGENIVQKTEPTEDGRNYDVEVDERTEKTQYEYGEDDLSLVDTNSGQKIVLGMSEADIEAIAGAPVQKDGNHRVYDGVVVKYADGAAVSFIVAGGQFKDGQETRYKTSRGIGVGSSADDFKKAYGDSYTEGGEETAADGETVKTASKAVRYFEKDGSKVKFLGTSLTSEQKAEDTSNYYMQDFMFSNTSGNIATMRISLMSAATGGM